MYYFYPCPKCGQPVYLYDNEPNAQYDATYKLPDLVKQHYQQMHTIEELLLTDEELLYAIKTGIQSSQSVPEV